MNLMKERRLKAILRCLLDGEKRFKDIQILKKSNIELNFNDMQLSRYLKELEIEKLISHNHLNKSYKITSKGLRLLKEIDHELKGKIFLAQILNDLNGLLFDYWYIFDLRIPQPQFKELYDMIEKMESEARTINSTKEGRATLYNEFQNKYISIMQNEKLEPLQPQEITFRNEFFVIVSRTIGDVMLFISLKAIEDKNPAVLSYLNTLPVYISQRLSFFNPERFKSSLVASGIWEQYYRLSKNLNVDIYKKFIDIFKNAPIDMLASVGDDFTEAGMKEQKELEKDLEILKNRISESNP